MAQLDIVNKEFIFYTNKPENGGHIYADRYRELNMWRSPHETVGNGEYFIGQEIRTGGAEGGSCWGSEARGFTSEETFDDAEILTKLGKVGLIDVKNMTFVEGLSFMRDMVKMYRSEREYYGNHTDYALKGVKIKVSGNEVTLC